MLVKSAAGAACCQHAAMVTKWHLGSQACLTLHIVQTNLVCVCVIESRTAAHSAFYSMHTIDLTPRDPVVLFLLSIRPTTGQLNSGNLMKVSL